MAPIWVAFGFQSAGGIDRQRAILSDEAVGDGLRPLPFADKPHRFVLDQFGDGETVMHLGKGQIAQADPGLGERALPGDRAAFELEDVATRHRQEILHVLGGAKHDGLVELQRCLDIRQHQGRGAVRDQRAVRTFQRTGDARILVALGAAEIVAEILADLRVGVADAVLVIFGGDAGDASD